MLALNAGTSGRAVAREFATTHSTAQQIKHNFTTRHTVKNGNRKGPPEVLTKTERRPSIRMAMKERDITWDALVKRSAELSAPLLKRIWKSMGRAKTYTLKSKSKASLVLHLVP
ncbi:hypothetical protein B0J13DRAFT_132092 [Dactylonectria estremocensis]|uniref:Transposase Tc1-like domain-containing protein n=1 Tax=Dactylonectria estremocensis TaxID=1079267 RepID=A0A9P9E311_9HYPO|nr:hypothetical protein B0J13DRAFT_132092 [Dactylonectria estremocensis]